MPIGAAPFTSTWGYGQPFHSNRVMYLRNNTLHDNPLFLIWKNWWFGTDATSSSAFKPYKPRVGRTVTWFNANGRPRPAVITAVMDDTHVDLRIGHQGEVVAGAMKRTPAGPRAAKWQPY